MKERELGLNSSAFMVGVGKGFGAIFQFIRENVAMPEKKMELVKVLNS